MNRWREQALAQCAERERWLPRASDGFRWHVHRLYGHGFKISLCKTDEGTYVTGFRPTWSGRIGWWWMGFGMRRRFERDKRYAITADEFVERYKAGVH